MEVQTVRGIGKFQGLTVSIVPDELKPQVRERLFAALEEEESAVRYPG